MSRVRPPSLTPIGVALCLTWRQNAPPGRPYRPNPAGSTRSGQQFRRPADDSPSMNAIAPHDSGAGPVGDPKFVLALLANDIPIGLLLDLAWPAPACDPIELGASKADC